MTLASFLAPVQTVPAAATAPKPAAFGSSAEGGSKRLPFSMERPQPTEWCWAATAAAISAFYSLLHHAGQAYSVCQVATKCLGSSCCPEPLDPQDLRNQEYALEGALNAVGHLAQDPIGGALDFSSVVGEINAQRPVCCHITWDAGNPDNGHFNAIVGYDLANQDVDVCDCLYGDQTLPYATFTNAYQTNGSWDVSYLTS
jgi:hypothetical protein